MAKHASSQFRGDGINEQIMSLALFWIYIYITGEIKKKINKNTKENKRGKETICWIVLGVQPEKSCTQRGTSSLYTSCFMIITRPLGGVLRMSKLWKPKKSDSGGSDASGSDDADSKCAGMLLLCLAAVSLLPSVWNNAFSALKQYLHHSTVCRRKRDG